MSKLTKTVTDGRTDVPTLIIKKASLLKSKNIEKERKYDVAIFLLLKLGI